MFPEHEEYFLFSKFIKLPRLKPQASSIWCMGLMFDTPALHVTSCSTEWYEYFFNSSPGCLLSCAEIRLLVRFSNDFPL